MLTTPLRAQAIPAAGVLTPLTLKFGWEPFQIPAITPHGPEEARLETVMVCNQAASATTFRVSLAYQGEADTPAQYLFYDVYLPANDTYTAQIPGHIVRGDVVRVQSANGQCSFQVFGTYST
jgi:hypothetical protein